MGQLSKKKIAGIFGLFFLLASIGISLIVVGQRQNIRKNASEPGSTEGVTVSLSPTTKTLRVGEAADTTIRIDTGSIAISAVSIHLTYPHTAQTPDLTLSDLKLASSQIGWNCPVKTITEDSTETHIEIGCLTTEPDGYTSLGIADFATFTIVANSAPPANPIVFRFDPNQSLVSRKSDNQDIVLTPISTGEFTITAGDPGITTTPSPSPTISPTGIAGVTPTASPTVSPTPVGSGGGIIPTITPTRTPSPTLYPTITGLVTTTTVTPNPSLPVTGNPNGTVWGVIVGITILVVGTTLLF